MNDQSSGWPPDFEDDDAGKQRAQSLQRAFMDRARRAVERENEPVARPFAHRIVAVVVALAVTFTIVFVFDAFLSSMQKVMRMMDEQEARQQQEALEKQQKEPMPAYVVPSN